MQEERTSGYGVVDAEFDLEVILHFVLDFFRKRTSSLLNDLEPLSASEYEALPGDLVFAYFFFLDSYGRPSPDVSRSGTVHDPGVACPSVNGSCFFSEFSDLEKPSLRECHIRLGYCNRRFHFTIFVRYRQKYCQ